MTRFSSARLVPALMLAVATARSVWGADPSLDKLVAPIALYPDPLVAQILPASTNPLEVFEAADAVASGTRPSEETASKWDPSVQALLSFPTVLKMMRDKIDWTTQLGKAFVSNKKGKGLGLGLFLSSATAERYGGDIRLYNHQGGGTEAELRLPITPERAS